MGSFKRPHAFDPLDLEIIDLVYEVAWEQISAREASLDTAEDEERQASLRKRVFALAGNGGVAISTLCSTGCLRACRSRLGRRQQIEITFSPRQRASTSPAVIYGGKRQGRWAGKCGIIGEPVGIRTRDPLISNRMPRPPRGAAQAFLMGPIDPDMTFTKRVKGRGCRGTPPPYPAHLHSPRRRRLKTESQHASLAKEAGAPSSIGTT